MEIDRKNIKINNKKKYLKKRITMKKSNLKIKYYLFIAIVILLNCLIFSFTIIRKNIFKNKKIDKLFKNKDNSNSIDCLLIKKMLKNRKQPFDFKKELYFFIDFNIMQNSFFFY